MSLDTLRLKECRATSVVMNTGEVEARLREFAREIPVVYLRNGIPFATGTALGNLREALRIRVKSKRINARAADYEYDDMSDVYDMLSWRPLDRIPHNRRRDFRCWKNRRDYKWRWPRSSCRPWAIAQALEDMDRPVKFDPAPEEELLGDPDDFLDDDLSYAEEVLPVGKQYASGDDNGAILEIRDDHFDFFHPWYGAGEDDEWSVPVAPQWGGSRDHSSGEKKDDYARQPHRSWKWRRKEKPQKFKIM